MTNQKQTLEEMTLRQLRKIASILNIPRYSRMRKQQLLNTIKIKKNNLDDVSPEKSVQSPPKDDLPKKPLSRFSDTDSPPNERRSPSYIPPDLQKSAPIQGQNVKVSSLNNSLKNLPHNFFFGVDDDLGELPESYGEDRVMLLPREPQWGYVYWDISPQKQKELRLQGGKHLTIRLYDVTDINLDTQYPHNVQEFLCGDIARAWYVPIPVSDRIYVVDIGYRCEDGRWLQIARSPQVKIPAVYPSDVVENVFATITWEQDLAKEKLSLSSSVNGNGNGKTSNTTKQIIPVTIPSQVFSPASKTPHSSTLQDYESIMETKIWASGIGLMSGSGAGFSGDLVSNRKFWLVANAELIVYGITDPNATVTIGNQQIKLNPDGTFLMRVPFPDGVMDYPIKAIAPDGEQVRSIHLRFNRETLSENTNTQEDAIVEWFKSK